MSSLRQMNQPDTSGYLVDILDVDEFKKIAPILSKEFGISPFLITRKHAWLYKNGWRKDKKAREALMPVSVDMYLYNIARRQGKITGGIENTDDQYRMMQEVMRYAWKPENISEQYDGEEKLLAAYNNADFEAIEKISSTFSSIEREILLVRRNLNMMQRIKALSLQASSFFAVGVSHLSGQNGLIAMLRQAGYTMTPVFSDKKILPESYQYNPVSFSWYPVSTKHFIASMPGATIDVHPYGDRIPVTICTDAGTGISYSISCFDVTATLSADSIVNAFSNRFIAGRNVKPESLVQKYFTAPVKNDLFNDDVRKFYESLDLNEATAFVESSNRSSTTETKSQPVNHR